MSGVVSSIGKVFKKVVSVVKKVLPIALAVGAIYFTAGAALGLEGTAGGWGSAVSGFVSKMGATGILGNVLTGAITQAGYGAAVGGLISGVTGGNIIKGMQGGAITGAITGGVMGGLGLQTDPLKGVLGNEAKAAESSLTGSAAGDVMGLPSNGLNPADTGLGVQQIGPISGEVSPLPTPDSTFTISGVPDPRVPPQSPITLTSTTTPTSKPTTTPSATSKTMLGEGGWVERNQDLVGRSVSGIGQGLLSGAASGDEAEALLERERMRQQEEERKRQQTIANFSGAGPGLLSPANTAYIQNQQPRPTPTQRFDPASYGGQFVLDAVSNQIIFVPTKKA